MRRVDKYGKKHKLNIQYIYKKDGTKLDEILKEGYLCYVKKLKSK